MEHFVRLLTVVATVLAIRDNDLEDVRNAVRKSYDTTASFDDNVKAIHALLCPQSVLCPTGDRSFDSYAERIDELLSYPNGIYPHHNQSVLNARTLVFNISGKMNGCCKFCSCKPICVERQNCCPAMTGYSDIIERPRVHHQCISHSIRKVVFNKDLTGGIFYGPSYYMVADCFPMIGYNFSKVTQRKCKFPDLNFPDQIIPVYSDATRRTYRNTYCAICNGDNDTIMWSLVMIAQSDTKPALNEATPLDWYRTLITGLQRKDIIMIPPSTVGSKEEDSFCVLPDGSEHKQCDIYNLSLIEPSDFFEQACSSFESLYLGFPYQLFRNVFCKLCMFYTRPRDQTLCVSSLGRFAGTLFTAILNFDDNTDVANKERSKCGCHEYHDPKKDICREVKCSWGNVYVDCQCTPLLKNISGMWSLMQLEVLPSTAQVEDQILHRRGQFEMALYSKIKKDLKLTMLKLTIKTVMISKFVSDINSNQTFHIIAIVKVGHGENTKQTSKTLLEGLKGDGICIKVMKADLQVKLGSITSIHTIPRILQKGEYQLNISRQQLTIVYTDPELLWSQTFNSQLLSKLFFCECIQLHGDEALMITHMDMVAGFTRAQVGYLYKESDQCMCFDDFVAIFGRATTELAYLPLAMLMIYSASIQELI